MSSIASNANISDLSYLVDARLNLVLSAMGGLFTDEEQAAFDTMTDLLAESVPALLNEIGQLRRRLAPSEAQL